jgi:hypothetical protein
MIPQISAGGGVVVLGVLRDPAAVDIMLYRMNFHQVFTGDGDREINFDRPFHPPTPKAWHDRRSLIVRSR